MNTKDNPILPGSMVLKCVLSLSLSRFSIPHFQDGKAPCFVLHAVLGSAGAVLLKSG